MIIAKINKDGGFELNRGGVFVEMKCMYSGRACNVKCPFFDYYKGDGFHTNHGRYNINIKLTCVEKEKEYYFLNENFENEMETE